MPDGTDNPHLEESRAAPCFQSPEIADFGVRMERITLPNASKKHQILRARFDEPVGLSSRPESRFQHGMQRRRWRIQAFSDGVNENVSTGQRNLEVRH